MEDYGSILVVDDNEKVRESLRDWLTRSGYSVKTACDGSQGLSTLKSESPEVVLLDVMLPDMDGFSVCREIRKFSDVPVIFLSGRDDEFDRVLGLELGADDYVTKPFYPREVVARIRAALRRSRKAQAREQESGPVRLGPLLLDEHRRRASLEGQALELTATEFSLLQVLMASPGRVYSREQLIEKIWGYDFEGEVRTVDSHVGNLRKKVKAIPDHGLQITAVRGVGYKLEGHST